MNHIKKLQAQVRALQAEKDALQEGITDLIAYLASPKFSGGDPLDGYVNVNDVFARIANARNRANDVVDQCEFIYGKLS